MLNDNPLILMYHSVDDKKLDRLSGIRVNIKTFEKQIAYLAKRHYHSFTLSEMIEQKETLPPKSVVITFDDGYKDNVTNALHILQKYNFKATLFLVIQRENNDWAIHRKVKNANIVNTIEKLSDDDVRELLASGLIEIGAHTVWHKNFETLSREEKEEEIMQSKVLIEKNFNIDCKTFSYPFGMMAKNDHLLVEKAGFIGAVTTERRRVNFTTDNLFLLPRVAIKNEYFKFIYKLFTV